MAIIVSTECSRKPPHSKTVRLCFHSRWKIFPKATLQKLLVEAIHNKHQSELLVTLLRPLGAADVSSLLSSELLLSIVDRTPSNATQRENLLSFVRSSLSHNLLSSDELFSNALLDVTCEGSLFLRCQA